MPKIKKSNKLSLLKKHSHWINPYPPFKGLLIFVIIFAVFGGGYYLYTSFASSSAIPPVIYQCYTPHPTIQSGSRGDCVKYVQWTLNNYFGTHLTIDGTFGSATVSAVKYFQTLGHLTADGIVGSVTWEHLDSAIRPYYNGSKGYARLACKNFAIINNSTGKQTYIIQSGAATHHYTVKITVKNTGAYNWGASDPYIRWAKLDGTRQNLDYSFVSTNQITSTAVNQNATYQYNSFGVNATPGTYLMYADISLLINNVYEDFGPPCKIPVVIQ